jgi:hypothetical protein
VNRFRRFLRLDKTSFRLLVRPANRRAERSLKQTLSHAIKAIAPTLIALSFAGVAHAQGTMDFSGAQTLMTTFKTLAAYIRRADEGTLSRLLIETTILLAASRTNAATVLRDAATAYKVDTDAITLKVKQEFAAKAKARKDAMPAPKARKAA